MSKFFSLIAALFLCITASAQSTAPTEPQSTTAQSTATVQATAAPQLYPRTQVIEEGTGTWCGFCPRGIVTIERLQNESKTQKNVVPFIVIAVHQGQGDYFIEPMEVSDYRFLRFSGFPGGIINRKKKVDMSLQNTRDALRQQPQKTPFNIKTKITKTDTFDYDITLTTTLGFDNHNTTLRMQYVLIEDHVGPYLQRNYFSGDSNHPWGNKSGSVSTFYNDVARAIYPVGSDAERVGVLPTEMRRGVPVSQTFHIFLPGSVQNASRLRIVGLLLDTQTGEILNADQQKLPTVVGTSTGIHSPLAPNAANSSDAHSANAPHYDLSGRPISPAQPGLHIVNGKKILDVRGE